MGVEIAVQWGQIKTLFILCFLVLDVFLISQFFGNFDSNPSYLQQSTKEEDLRANVEGLDNLEKEVLEESYLFATRKEFGEEDVESLSQFKNQNIVIVNSDLGSLVVSKFIEPVPINTDSYSETLQANIFESNKYQLWTKDENSNTLIFFQNMDKTIYFNQGGLLLVVLNDEGQMIQYVQTMLVKEEKQLDSEDLITAFEAVSNLHYNAKVIHTGDKVTNRGDIGYHNIYGLPNGSQVLAPTWRIEVNNERNYFVNAVEGHYYQRYEGDFLRETILSFRDSIQAADESEFLFVNDEEEETIQLVDEIIQEFSNLNDTTIGVEKNDFEL